MTICWISNALNSENRESFSIQDVLTRGGGKKSWRWFNCIVYVRISLHTWLLSHDEPSCSGLRCASLQKRFRRARSRAVRPSKILVCGILATAGLNNDKHVPFCYQVHVCVEFRSCRLPARVASCRRALICLIPL